MKTLNLKPLKVKIKGETQYTGRGEIQDYITTNGLIYAIIVWDDDDITAEKLIDLKRVK